MKAKILMPLAICTLSLILVSCSEPKEEPCELEGTWKYFPITEDEKKFWPLNELDSFSLLSNKNQKVTYTGKAKYVYFESENVGTSNCSYYNRYEYQLYHYTIANTSKVIWASELNRKRNSLLLRTYVNDSLINFIIPFNLISQSQYTHNIATNKGIIKCLAVGDSIYYNQTEGIIRFVQNDSTYWTREF